MKQPKFDYAAIEKVMEETSKPPISVKWIETKRDPNNPKHEIHMTFDFFPRPYEPPKNIMNLIVKRKISCGDKGLDLGNNLIFLHLSLLKEFWSNCFDKDTLKHGSVNIEVPTSEVELWRADKYGRCNYHYYFKYDQFEQLLEWLDDQ